MISSMVGRFGLAVRASMRTCAVLQPRAPLGHCARLFSTGGVEGKETEAKEKDGEPDSEAAGPPDMPGLLLASVFKPEDDPTGMYMSEKLDGIRAYWDGTALYSRYGKKLHAPDFFIKKLPATELDGELWMGRGKFQECVGVVRAHNSGDKWNDITFMVFDAPFMPGGFNVRIGALEAIARICKPHMKLVEQTICESKEHLQKELDEVIANGGEGVMLRAANSEYEFKRSRTLLKVKVQLDDEATVIGYTEGKNKHTGKVGALMMRNKEGVEFKIGSGLTDADRAAPPPIGSVVTYRYQSLTNARIPRFPTFLRVRSDSGL